MSSRKRTLGYALFFSSLLASALAYSVGIGPWIPIKIYAESTELEAPSYSDGVYQVGVEIAPGTYIADNIRETCYVQLVDAEAGRRNYSFVGRAILTIPGTDVEFYSTACGTWTEKPTDLDDEPESQFGEGVYEIGADIESGVYVSSENDGRCFWYSVPDFTFEFEEEPQIFWWRDGAPIAIVNDGDAGFYSVRCGSWTKLTEREISDTLREFGDGSYLVGREIPPGTYRSDGGEAECAWYRVTPFTSESGDHSASNVSYGRQIVTILERDHGFYSRGCGVWREQSLEDDKIPENRIHQGTHLVGYDIKPGTYVAESSNNKFCRWTTLSGFSGRPREISSSGIGVSRGIVNIGENVLGFTSVNCETWIEVSEAAKPDAATSFGDGEYVVGFHIEPGLYRAPGAPIGRCLWRRLTDFTGASSEIVATNNVVGRVIARIQEGDAGFEAYTCGAWEPLVLEENQEPSRTEFGRGSWAVGVEVAPGTYVADVPDRSQCFWSRVSDFTGQPDDFITFDNTPNHAVMTILEDDVGVYSDGCGVWALIAEVEEPVTAQEIEDGVYVVGRDVAPGTYTSTREGDAQCFWSRVDSFTGDLYERVAVYGVSGRAIVTIREDDIGFRAWNCGIWKPFPEPSQSILSSFGDGTYAVGVDVAPGIYRAVGARATCRWRRMSDFTWNEGVLADVHASGIVVAEILVSDVGFSSQNCGVWEPIEINEDSASDPEISASISPGYHIVGAEVAPGAYITEPWPTNTCRWARVSDFSGNPSAVIAEGASNGQSIVTISEKDAGFITRDCKTWRLLAEPDEITDSHTTMTDGVYRVGVDIQPGTYEVDTGDEMYRRGRFIPACQWRRLADFTHEAGNIIESGFARGKHTVTIEPSDAGFATNNCGEWRMIEPESG